MMTMTIVMIKESQENPGRGRELEFIFNLFLPPSILLDG